MNRIEGHGCFGGRQEVWKHASATLGCDMRFGVYLPPAAVEGQRCPVLYFLAGLTCNEQTFITKAGGAGACGAPRIHPRRARHQPARPRRAQ